MHSFDDLLTVNPHDLLMDDEIGHVRIRLFKTDGRLCLNSIAYMGRQLTEDEARALTNLWNDVETFLRSLRPTQTQNDNEDE